MANATGFRRVQTTQRWNARRAAQVVDPQTPDNYGWVADDVGAYTLPGVDDVVLVPAPALPGYLLRYDSNHQTYVPPGWLKRLTAEIKKDNEI